MTDQFVGEIKMVGFNFAPVQWALAAGQILPISQNTALFSLLGTQYGGNGTSNFALPDLQGRAAGGLGVSDYSAIGEVLGTESESIIGGQYAAHSHGFQASSAGGSDGKPLNGFAATVTGTPTPYVNVAGAALQALSNTGTPVIGNATGGNLPHANMMPFLAMNYIIALQGVFPSRN